MAEAGGIRAGAAWVEIFVKGNINKELDRVAKKLKNFGASITEIGKKTALIGSAITAPLLIAAQRFADMGDQVNKASQRTGIAVEALSKLQYAAEQSAVPFDDLEKGIHRMQQSILYSQEGLQTYSRAFAHVGLKVQDLQGLAPEKQFQVLAEKISQIQDPTTRAAVAMEIFGRSGAHLLPLFQDGAAGMHELMQRAAKLGLVIGGQDAQAATEFGDNLSDLWKQVQMVGFQIGAAVAQALMPFASIVQKALKSVIDWTRENRAFVIGILAAGAALVTLGAGFIGVGLAIKTVGFALSGVLQGFTFVSLAIGLLTNPIVLVIVALGALGAYLLVTTQNGQKLLKWLGDKFSLLADTAKEAFGGIADALKAGDIKLAMQILWAGLKLAWIQGTQELQNKWTEFKGFIIKVGIEAFYGVLDAYEIVKAALCTAFGETASFFVDAWHKAVEETTKAFDFLEQRERQHAKDRIRRDQAAGKLTKAQADRMIQNVDDQADQVLAARHRQDEAAKAQRKKELEDRLAQIKKERDARLSAIGDAEKSLTGAVDTNTKKDIADLEAEKKSLEDQLAQLRSQAGTERKSKDKGPPSLIGPGKLDGLNNAVKNGQKATAKSAGLFNVAAIQTLQGGSSTQDAIKKASEQTAINTKAIVAAVKSVILNFVT